MGRPKAMEMLCFGRKINAYEAKERNLVSCIYPHETFQADVQVRIKIVLHSNELESDPLYCFRKGSFYPFYFRRFSKMLLKIHILALLNQSRN